MGKRTKLAIGAFAAALLSAEIIARMLGFGSPLLYRRSLSGYEIVPSQQVTRLGKTTHINSLGLRGPEVAATKPAGTFRVLALGDSVTNGGTRLDDDETFPARLGTLLAKNSCNAEVLNASAGGWAIGNGVNWIADHGIFDADVVLVIVNQQDLFQQTVTGQIVDASVSFPSARPVSGLGEIVTRYALPRLGLAASAADPGSEKSGPDQRAFDFALSEIIRLRQLAEAKGARLVMAFHNLRDAPDPAQLAAQAAFSGFAKKEGIAMVNLGLGGTAESARHYADSIHLTSQGHAAVAQRLLPFIRPLCQPVARARTTPSRY